jgi:methylmalonyl-CoA/ethylmalonyl-CoA epimerase
MRFHHIGIACKDIVSTKSDIEKAHVIENSSDIIFDEAQNVSLCLLTLKEGVALELVSGDAVEPYIKKGVSYYHVCYEVDNVVEKYNELVENGFLPVSPLKPAKLFGMRRVGFLYSSFGMIELLEA